MKKLGNLTRDQAKRRFRKQGKDIHGSKKFIKTLSKKKGKGKPIFEKSGKGHLHGHTPDRKNFQGGRGGHGFTNSLLLIPGSTIGATLFGDNAFGKTIDFINPISDIQDVADFLEEMRPEPFCEYERLQEENILLFD